MNSASIVLCLLISGGVGVALCSIRKQKESGHCQGCPHEDGCPFHKLKK